MFYAISPLGYGTGRVRLYPSAAAARAHARDGEPIVAVAIHLDVRSHRVMPDPADPPGIAWPWEAPAEEHGDGSVTVRGAIPLDLLVETRDPPAIADPAEGREGPAPSRADADRPAGAGLRPAAEVCHRVECLDPDGLHLRVAAEFAERARQFDAAIRVRCDGSEVDGKSVLGLLTLGAGCGTRLDLVARGADAESAVAALADLIAGRPSEACRCHEGIRSERP